MRTLTVALEGSTYHGSVALISDREVVAERSLGAGSNDSGIERSGKGESLMPAIAECFAEAGASRGEIARIVCGAGPGSFTSLRVAGSVAKGLAVGYGVELYAVSSLLLTVAGMEKPLVTGPYLSLLNAMRDEFFAHRVMVEEDGKLRKMGGVGLLGATDVADLQRRESQIHFIGPGQKIDASPHARGVARLIDDIVRDGAVNISAWEPDYGRLAEAQVRWEAEHGRPLPT